MNTNKGKIYLLGDVHGTAKLMSSTAFPEGKNLTKDDVVIQLGDWGLVYSPIPTKDELYWLGWVAAKPWTTLVLLGNHDNHQKVWDLPQEEKYGGVVYVDHRKSGTIWYLKTGEIYTIQGKTFLAVHGGLSIDKAYRTEGKSWWATEYLSREQETAVLDNLDKINWKVDYLLSHATADSVMTAFLDNPNSPKFNDSVSRFLEFICNRLEFKANLFGHYHNARVFVDAAGDYYECFWGPPKLLDEEYILNEKTKHRVNNELA